MVAASRWSWPGRATLAVPATVNASAAGLAPGADRRADPRRLPLAASGEAPMRTSCACAPLRSPGTPEERFPRTAPTIIRKPRDRDDRGVARGPTETVLGLVLR